MTESAPSNLWILFQKFLMDTNALGSLEREINDVPGLQGPRTTGRRHQGISNVPTIKHLIIA